MDTIRLAERLAEGGVFSDEQAKRLATSLADHMRDELATKHDLELLRRDIEAELGLVRTDMGLLRRDMETGMGLLRRDLGGAETRLRTEFKADLATGLASVRNQLLATHLGSFIGIILYITFKV
jgi:hypothetical protein